MKIGIESNIIRHYLKNAYFITGTAYAGKSTMTARLAREYDMIFCGENYHAELSDQIAVPEAQPAMGYFLAMESWQSFLARSPEAYVRWLEDCSREAAEFEIARLISLSGEGRRMIVDTNIPLETLREIAPWRHVAVMLSPQSTSVDRFFDRDDPEKQFLLAQIQQSDDPEALMANFRACLALANSLAVYESYKNSGFFVIERGETWESEQQTAQRLARHFGLAGEA